VIPRIAGFSTCIFKALEATGCTVEALERLADGEEPTEVLGPERAARLVAALDALDGCCAPGKKDVSIQSYLISQYHDSP
jgi:hypothetical protein